MERVRETAECGDVERGPVFNPVEHRYPRGCAFTGTGSQRTDRMSLWDVHEQESGFMLTLYISMYVKMC